MTYALIHKSTKTIPLIPVLQTEFKAWIGKQSALVQAWIKTQHFKAEPATFCAISDAKGKIKQVIVGVGTDRDLFSLAHLPMALPEGRYHVEDKAGLLEGLMIELGWGLGAYQFTRYKKAKRAPAELVWRKKTDHKPINDLLAATYLVRDLVNTPADDMNTPHLAVEAKKSG